jgi:predicted 3-demethylubiquinone-9 3-methyltransferase (glyoxalase superfamily)
MVVREGANGAFGRAMQAMLQMQKIDIQKLKDAVDGK